MSVKLKKPRKLSDGNLALVVGDKEFREKVDQMTSRLTESLIRVSS